MDGGDDDGGGSDGGEDVYNGKAEPVLVSVLDSYSDDNTISVSDSRYSSYPAYTVKIVDSGLHFFFFFYFLFSIFRTTWVKVYQSRCHISHNLMA